MKKSRRISMPYLIIYCGILFLIWSLREIFLRPIMENSLNEWLNVFVSSGIKLIVWTLPAIILMLRFETDLGISVKEMLSYRAAWLRYILIACGLLAYNALMAYIIYKTVGINPDFRASSLIGRVVFIGVTEEIVFRAWLLNAFLKKSKTWIAILTSTALFLLIHFPLWLSRQQFLEPANFLLNCAGVVGLSILFSWTFIKSRNIFVPIVLHMSWNLFNTLFMG